MNPSSIVKTSMNPTLASTNALGTTGTHEQRTGKNPFLRNATAEDSPRTTF